MKFIKTLVIAILINLVFVSTTYAATYKNGDKVEILEASINVDSTIISFTLPSGGYPSNSKIAIYAQKDVYCPMPGYVPVDPTIDKNPFILLAEYALTEIDIKALKASDATFITTAKFDSMCGEIYAKIFSAQSTIKPNDVLQDRPSGTMSSGNKDSDVILISMPSGTRIKNVKFDLLDQLLIYDVPQGSYTLGDYLIVLDGIIPIAKTTITNELMDKLANGYIELKDSVTIQSTEKLQLIVSDTDMELGVESVLPEEPQTHNEKENNSINPLLIGIATFILVLTGGLAITYFRSKKSK